MPSPRKIRPALPVLACLLLPFVVGFDVPDSTGTFVKVAGGRGAYHVSGCKRSYDSELIEGNISMRATVPTASGQGTTFWSKAAPAKTTLGVFGNFTNERLTVTDTLGVEPESLESGDVVEDHGLAGGVYAHFDWRWVGLQVGVGGFSVLQKTEDVDRQGGSPILGLRAGPENLFLSGQVYGATPLYTRGGLAQMGVGGRIGATRLWGGMGTSPYRATMVTLKGSQNLGPVTLSAAGMVGTKEPSGSGLNREYGFSVGLEAGIPGVP
jgi:hypothetical protein